MSQDTNIPNLIINKLTKAQYEGTIPSNTELYFITDEDSYIASNQGLENAGKVLTVGNDGSVSPQDPVGITDYTNLINKPQINGNVLTGNKTASQLGFADVSTSGSYTDLIDVPTFATVATSGSYNDLSNKPTIPAAQQQVDWNSTTGITSIANKPTLATVATSGAYSDLSGTPTLSSVATSGDYTDLSNKPTIEDLTTIAQQSALNSGANTTNIAQITTNQTDISTINSKIPSAATSSNQLADKAFVNSSISNMAANYVTSDAQGDNFATKAALLAGPYYYKGQSYTLTNNDYALVESDETKNNATTRYMYDGTQWNFQYIVNSAPFNQAQLDAINSTITSNLVSSYSNHIADTDIHVTSAQKTSWTAKQDALVSGTNIKTINNQSLLGSGNITISGGGSSLPDMTGQSGKFLTNNGSTANWSTLDNAIVTYTLPDPDDPEGDPITYNEPLSTIITNLKTTTDFDLEDRLTILENKVGPIQPTVIDFWVDSTTGAVTCNFSHLPLTKVVHTVIGNTTISGTWNNDYSMTQVFTPTNADDILNNPNGFIVSISGFLE